MLSRPEIDDDKADAALEVMRGAGAAGDRARVTSLEQLEGGWSRHSWVMAVEDPDHDGQRELVLRVRPRGGLLATDLEQEFHLYEALGPTPVPTPAVHGLQPDWDTPFDGQFFVMERVAGSSPNVWRRRDRTELEEAWQRDRRLATDLVETMAAIHAVKLDGLEGRVVVRSFRETLEHWRGVQDEVRLVRDPVVDEAYAWALDHDPGPVDATLVHGDYRIGNCMVDEGRLSGVLDWELSFVGDWRFDHGYMALDYHAGKFAKPGSELLNSVAERGWFQDRYTELTGRAVDDAVVRTFSVVGALMLIAILNTGIRVFADGGTADIRMAWSRFAVPGLRQDMVRLMGW